MPCCGAATPSRRRRRGLCRRPIERKMFPVQAVEFRPNLPDDDVTGVVVDDFHGPQINTVLIGYYDYLGTNHKDINIIRQ